MCSCGGVNRQKRRGNGGWNQALEAVDRSWAGRTRGFPGRTGHGDQTPSRVLGCSGSSALLREKERGLVTMYCKQTPTSARQLKADRAGPVPSGEEVGLAGGPCSSQQGSYTHTCSGSSELPNLRAAAVPTASIGSAGRHHACTPLSCREQYWNALFPRPNAGPW